MSGPSTGSSIRQLIVEVARRQLAEGGLAALTIRQVAREVGVDPGTVRHYFPSKDRLADAAAHRELDLAGAYQHALEEVGRDATAGTALLAAACKHIPYGQLTRAAIAVCLTGGDYEATVLGAFHREVVEPAAEATGTQGPGERAAIVMSALIGAHLVEIIQPGRTLSTERARRVLARAFDDQLQA
ncbi:MAG TPA: helix-turn-helix domain-containing protein [Jatrophihabitans sp.]|nr:helix-turn-helix domain-containing protein [Jatrophihabitans sp.]